MNIEEKEKIFEEAFRENRDRIYRLCYTSLNNKEEADDLFQEVMINVWRGLDGFRKESQLSTWIYRITVNTALLFNKRFRTKANRFIIFDPDKMDKTHPYTDPFQNSIDEDLQLLNKAIAGLKKQDRLIIGLFLEGVSYEEISDIVGISANYVGVKINRIKAELAKRMEEMQ